MANPILHVEIAVTDLERAMAFYALVLAVQFEPVMELHDSRMAHFPFTAGTDGASCALCQGDAYRPSQAGPIVYFAVENVDAALARAEAAGSTVIFPATRLEDGTVVAEVSDSEGNRLALQSAPAT